MVNIDERCYGYQPAENQLKQMRNHLSTLGSINGKVLDIVLKWKSGVIGSNEAMIEIHTVFDKAR